MRIGQLARLIGIDTQTIRFYEQQGLLPPPDRQANGYRVYTEKHGERLAFIRRCRILNLSLPEIHALQSYQDDPRQPCTAVNALLDDHISNLLSNALRHSNTGSTVELKILEEDVDIVSLAVTNHG